MDDGVPLTKIKEPESTAEYLGEGPDFPDNVSRGLKHPCKKNIMYPGSNSLKSPLEALFFH